MLIAPRFLPLGAIFGCLAISACTQTDPPPAYTPQEPASVSEQAPPAAEVAIDPATVAGPTALTEIAEASRLMGLPASGACSFDRINGETIGDATSVRVRDPANFSVSGWVVDQREMARPHAVLRLQEVDSGRAWEIGVGPGTDRGDVGRYLKNEELKDAGFQVEVDLSAMPSGEYALSLNHHSGGVRVVCDKGRRIIVGS